MATLRELKGRIGSVASSEKITGAMKMISSAKMHRAEADLRRLLPFRSQIETIIGNLLSADAEFSSPLTEEREVKRVGIVVLGSDDGLCGGYNINIFKDLLARLKECREKWGEDVDFTVYTVGRKIHKAVAKLQDPHLTEVNDENVNSKSGGDVIKGFASMIAGKFLSGELDTVQLLYMNFQSVSRQRVRYEQYIPVDASTFSAEGVKALCRPYIFEPDAASIFRSVLPMFLLSVMQEVFTENRASEQAARIMAMQSANDNAKNLLEQLQLEYNKLRQQSITTELLDIIGGQVKN
ncbi:ATP synthase F1 subunit gamma [uncultured Duncaniella sp.]|jgi:F-type H+-transporting ATPase subunit gamma|uniref:ATP synthase F1 subunit gamma n=1 Tax=uncultured Duncaniella sp. TaxID=2768039 RepID=UPI002675D051|nr:ATP synthase F1 subunit gamma [uncultured Duncaniella sp.]MCI9171791.1 ATP synthase F1 subunit gamma [Muribaculaceae bacterium]